MKALLSVLFNRFPTIAGALDERVADAINNGVNNFIAAADPNTPVDTGELKGSKVIEYASAGTLKASVEYTAGHSVYVHEGTVFMEGRPFAADAADAIWPEYEAELAAALEGAV